MSNDRVVVVDTTADYVDYLFRHYPQRVVFAADPAKRARGREAAPPDGSEILVDPRQPEKALDELRRGLARGNLRPSGVACFDCDALRFAAVVARELGLPFPSERAVGLSRNKFLSKQLWQSAGVDCPAAALIEQPAEALAFAKGHGGRTIIKPQTGSGSELVFLGATFAECRDALATMRRRLHEMVGARMYDAYEVDGRLVDPREAFVAEECVDGVEHSCDFFIDGEDVQIVRLTRKWLKPDPAPGTALAYEASATWPPAIARDRLATMLRAAAQAVGIERALCMADFIAADERLVLLELAPRPGGDCLPPLLRRRSGLDVLGLALDVAERRPWRLPPAGGRRTLVGLRLFAPGPGEIVQLDAGALRRDPRVEEVRLTARVGRRVTFPPDDYESRILGYAIFAPSAGAPVERQIRELAKLLVVRRKGE